MNRLINVLLLAANILLLFTEVYAGTYTEAYSWRDYYGDVPHDAIAGGFNKYHKPLYLGQVLYDGKIIAGKIIEGDENIHIEYFEIEYLLKNNVKVLCSHQPEKLTWISTNNTDLPDLASKKVLISGGFEPSCTTYLGRLPPDNDVTNVGKVMCCKANDDCYGLYTADNGTGQLHSVFEVLGYVQDKPGTVVKVATSGQKDANKKLTIDVVFD